MKKLLAVILCAAFLAVSVIPSAAVTYTIDYNNSVNVGEYITLYNSDFEDKNGDTPVNPLTHDNYSVMRSFTLGKSYIEGAYFNDDTEALVLVTDPNERPEREGQPLVGKITLTDRDTSDRYYCNFSVTTTGTVKTYDYIIFRNSNSEVDSSGGKYVLPYDYEYNTTTFGKADGTFVADFGGATFTVKVKNQTKLFLGYNNLTPSWLANRLDGERHTVYYTYYSWYGLPQFQNTGTLVFDADGYEYLYLIDSDDNVSLVKGSYSSSKDTHTVKTNTLSHFLLTDEKLSFVKTSVAAESLAGAGTSSSSSAAPSSSSVAPSSSSVAPSSSSVAPSSSSVAPSSSSVAPSSSSVAPSSSSVAPSSSSVVPSSSSASESSSSASETESVSSSSAAESSSATQVIKPTDDDKDSGSGFPMTTIIIAVLAAVIILLLILLFAGPRRKRSNFDDWDD